MTRIVIHAGFHKTGTTSVQTALHANRVRLSPHMRCYLRPDFEQLAVAAREFSVAPTAPALAVVAEAARDFFAGLSRDDRRPILMSSEDLSGHMPGRHGLDRYDAAPLVMAQIAEALAQQFGDAADPVFFFSTRSREEWLNSTWWQNLRSTRLALDFDDYSRVVEAAADLDAVLHEIAEAVAPARAVSMDIEDSAPLPQGPLTPLLDLCGVEDGVRTELGTIDAMNVRPDVGLEDVFLALNRSGLNNRNLAEAKRLLRQIGERQSRR